MSALDSIAIKALEHGASYERVATRLGINRSTVFRLWRRYQAEGIAAGRPTGRQPISDERRAAAVAMARDGFKAYAIAYDLGVSEPWVYKFLSAARQSGELSR